MCKNEPRSLFSQRTLPILTGLGVLFQREKRRMGRLLAFEDGIVFGSEVADPMPDQLLELQIARASNGIELERQHKLHDLNTLTSQYQHRAQLPRLLGRGGC